MYVICINFYQYRSHFGSRATSRQIAWVAPVHSQSAMASNSFDVVTPLEEAFAHDEGAYHALDVYEDENAYDEVAINDVMAPHVMFVDDSEPDELDESVWRFTVDDLKVDDIEVIIKDPEDEYEIIDTPDDYEIVDDEPDDDDYEVINEAPNVHDNVFVINVMNAIVNNSSVIRNVNIFNR